MRISSSLFAVLAVIPSFVFASQLKARASYAQSGVIQVGGDAVNSEWGPSGTAATPDKTADVSTTAAAAPPSSNTLYVKVGAEGFQFTPPQVSANIGDLIVFEYYPLNHSTRQSSFDNPCAPMDGGIDLGFHATNGSSVPTANITVTQTTPMWFFCEQKDHCPIYGMVFAVNPTPEKNFTQFAQNANGTASSTLTTSSSLPTATIDMTAAVATTTYSATSASVVVATASPSSDCSCVCNLDFGNGLPNPQSQGIGGFGGDLGKVPVPIISSDDVSAAAVLQPANAIQPANQVWNATDAASPDNWDTAATASSSSGTWGNGWDDASTPATSSSDVWSTGWDAAATPSPSSDQWSSGWDAAATPSPSSDQWSTGWDAAATPSPSSDQWSTGWDAAATPSPSSDQWSTGWDAAATPSSSSASDWDAVAASPASSDTWAETAWADGSSTSTSDDAVPTASAVAQMGWKRRNILEAPVKS